MTRVSGSASDSDPRTSPFAEASRRMSSRSLASTCCLVATDSLPSRPDRDAPSDVPARRRIVPDACRGARRREAPGRSAVAILPAMLEDVRNYVRAGIGAVASQSADAIPGALASKAQSLAEQFASFAAGFLEWSGEARASLVTELKLLVAGQIQEMGLASQEDMERLTARV